MPTDPKDIMGEDQNVPLTQGEPNVDPNNMDINELLGAGLEPGGGNTDEMGFNDFPFDMEQEQTPAPKVEEPIPAKKADEGNVDGRLEAVTGALEQMQNQLKQQQSQQVQEPAAKEEEPFQIPPPPEEPKRPAGYSMEEVLGDPKSESAIYAQERDEWQQKMTRYNAAVMQYLVYQQQQTQQETAERQNEANENTRQREVVAETRRDLIDNEGLTPAQADQFIGDVTDPEFYDKGTLLQVWRAKNGQRIAINEPGPDFQQRQRAQQLRRNLGLNPAGQQQSTKPVGEQLMGAILKNAPNQSVIPQ